MNVLDDIINDAVAPRVESGTVNITDLVGVVAVLIVCV